MAQSQLITIPARRGKAARLNAGQSIKVINTYGEQVVDTWAFVADDLLFQTGPSLTRPSELGHRVAARPRVFLGAINRGGGARGTEPI